ncbi:MAG: tol-pal system protein YbgF [Syntrophobacterales bacterium]|nr:MAG: tol-pal system protein YbgF [Syntrophobacterales bacterium]
MITSLIPFRHLPILCLTGTVPHQWLHENPKASFLSLTKCPFSFTHRNIFKGEIMGRIRVFITVFSILTLSGCASQDTALRKQAELESRIESLAMGSNMTTQRVTALTNAVRDLQEQRKQDTATLRELRDSMMNLRGLTDELLTKKAISQTTLTPEKIELINKEETGSPQQKNDVPSETYLKAFGLYSADKYEEAIDSFTAFIKTYPDSEYAANAQYWIGECYYTRSELPKALDSFKKVISNYPHGSKVPDAMLKAGYTLFAMKQSEKATSMLESLISKYPDSPAALRAKDKLLQR